MYSMWSQKNAGDLSFQKLSFSIDFYWSDSISLCFSIVIEPNLEQTYAIYSSKTSVFFMKANY